MKLILSRLSLSLCKLARPHRFPDRLLQVARANVLRDSLHSRVFGLERIGRVVPYDNYVDTGTVRDKGLTNPRTYTRTHTPTY